MGQRTTFDTGTGQFVVRDKLEVLQDSNLANTTIDNLTVSGILVTDNLTNPDISVSGNLTVIGTLETNNLTASNIDQTIVAQGDAEFVGNLSVTSTLTVQNDLIVQEDFFVFGNLVQSNVQELETANSFITLQSNVTYGALAAANSDVGIKFVYPKYNTASRHVGFFGWDQSTSSFTFLDNIDLADLNERNPVGTPADIKFGTVNQGIWQASIIQVPHGGTGNSTFTANGVLYGSGQAAIQSTAAGSYDSNSSIGELLRVSSTGAPEWSNVIDGGTF